MLKEHLIMLKGAFSHFHYTGCLWGSSQRAAETLTAPMRKPGRSPMNILEVGAGTGAVTNTILEHMQPGDTLTINEINPEFIESLRKRLESMPKYQQMKDNISFFCGPIQDYQADRTFDFLVCALPFLNFDLQTVSEIFEKFKSMSHDGTIMTYFEYLGIRPVSKIISPTSRKKRITEIDSYFRTTAPKRVNAETCWFNILPMNVYTLEMAV